PPPWVGRRGRPVHLNSLAEVERLPEARPGGRPPQSPILVAAEVGQHGEHPAVILRRRLQLELAEDDPDVALDGSFGEPEPIADRRVGTTLRHELEDLSFARREVVQRARRATPTEERRDHFGIDDRAAATDPLDRVDELGEVADTVLQEVPDAAWRVAEEPQDVPGLDVLRQDQQPDRWVRCADLAGNLETF